MKRAIVYGRRTRTRSFSLAEVVIALGVVTVGIVAVLGVFPAALQTGHSAQDETRAAHIAQSVIGSLAASASTHFSNAQLPLYPSPSPAPTPLSIDLTSTSGTSPAITFYADNDGKLFPNASLATYVISIYTNNAAPGFTDPATANQ